MKPVKPIPKRSDKALRALVAGEDTSDEDRAYAARVLIDRGIYDQDILRASTPDRCEHGRSVWGSCGQCEEDAEPVVKWIKQYGAVCKAVEGEIKEEFDAECSDLANYNHLRYMFQGYREYSIFGEQAECPYHPGGARSFSWGEGVKAAKRDKARELPPPPPEDEDEDDG